MCRILHHLDNIICFFFFFFNDTATTEIYTLSLHDALPISLLAAGLDGIQNKRDPGEPTLVDPDTLSDDERRRRGIRRLRSEEHTSELQSRLHLVCRLLLEKKKQRV